MVSGRLIKFRNGHNLHCRIASGGLAEAMRTSSSETPAEAGVGNSVRLIKRALLAILLNARGAQPGQPVLIDRILPGQEFLDRQRVAAACFFKGQQPATDGGNDFRLATDDPPLGPWCRKIGNGQGGTVWPD